MATIQVIDANGGIVHLDVTGSGTAGDPYRVKSANGDAILTSLAAIETATETVGGIVAGGAMPVSCPLTDGQLRASAVSVSSTDLGNVADGAVAGAAQNGSVIAVLKGLLSELTGFNERLAHLTRAILHPIWLDISTGTLRFQAISGTITTVSTVSTVSNQTQMGAVDAKTAFVDVAWHNAWANAIRDKIT